MLKHCFIHLLLASNGQQQQKAACRNQRLSDMSVLLTLQLIMEGVKLMKERILEEKRRRELRPASKVAALASMLLPAPATVLKAKRAFKRDMISQDLTIKAQLVRLAKTSHHTPPPFPHFPGCSLWIRSP